MPLENPRIEFGPPLNCACVVHRGELYIVNYRSTTLLLCGSSLYSSWSQCYNSCMRAQHSRPSSDNSVPQGPLEEGGEGAGQGEVRMERVHDAGEIHYPSQIFSSPCVLLPAAGLARSEKVNRA